VGTIALESLSILRAPAYRIVKYLGELAADAGRAG